MSLNNKQKKLIRALLEHGTFETTTFFAKKAEISWNTANEYLYEFKKKGWIFHHPQGNRDYWKGVAEQ